MRHYFQYLKEFYKNTLFEAKLYLVKKNMAEIQSNHINWYIIIFILSSLLLKITSLLEKQCSCSGRSSDSLAKISFHMPVSRIEKRMQGIIECYFSDYTGNVYITMLSICDVLVIVAVLNRKHYQLIYPWLFAVAMILVLEIFLILSDLRCGCTPTVGKLLILTHVSYSWCYIYMWGNMVHCPYN